MSDGPRHIVTVRDYRVYCIVHHCVLCTEMGRDDSATDGHRKQHFQVSHRQSANNTQKLFSEVSENVVLRPVLQTATGSKRTFGYQLVCESSQLLRVNLECLQMYKCINGGSVV